jgi:hypothetical protein
MMSILKKLKLMKIKRFKKFNEELSGTELVGPIGPGYGETRTQNKTISPHHTTVFEFDGRFYTEDEYNELYNEYLKRGGKPLFGFNKENIEEILIFLGN